MQRGTGIIHTKDNPLLRRMTSPLYAIASIHSTQKKNWKNFAPVFGYTKCWKQIFIYYVLVKQSNVRWSQLTDGAYLNDLLSLNFRIEVKPFLKSLHRIPPAY